MANQVVVKGVTEVRVNTGSAYEVLGYSRDQVEIREEAFYADVPGDQHGGPEGPPIDVQFLGRVDHVRCELTKFDAAVALKLSSRLSGVATGAAVATANIGDLMIQDSKDFAVFLNNASDPRVYANCIIRQPIEVGAGTKFSTLILEFEAHRTQATAGTIYSTTT